MGPGRFTSSDKFRSLLNESKRPSPAR